VHLNYTPVCLVIREEALFQDIARYTSKFAYTPIQN
jgi:hypothetical protein